MSDSLSGVLRFSLNHLIMVSAVASIQQRQANRPDLDPVVLPRTRSFMAFGIFLFFGAVMAILASTTLLWQGTVLDRVWPLNPTAYKQLTALGGIVGIFFLCLTWRWPRQESGGLDSAYGDGDLRSESSPCKFWGMSLTASGATGCGAGPVSSSRVHCCSYFCGQGSEPSLPKISFGSVSSQTAVRVYEQFTSPYDLYCRPPS